MDTHRLACCAACVAAITTLPLRAQGEAPEFEDVAQQLGPDLWRLTWVSEAGRTYRLERSFDLESWAEVGTITASGPATSLDDDGFTGSDRAFWRVGDVTDEPGEPLVVGEVAVAYQLAGAGSTVTYQVVAGGTEVVSEVVFLDGGTPLGPAEQGFGDVWSLTLPWDPSTPASLEVQAEASTEEATTLRSEVERLLLADPSRFVPLTPTGEPLHGQFIELEPGGQLGAFAYFPEGIGDPAATAGVRLEFPAGATLDTAVSGSIVSFHAGTFFRGHADESPVQVTAGNRSLDLDQLTPATIAPAFDLPAGAIALRWGDGSVAWESGGLDDGGWSSLQVELPIGDFGLPGGRLNATVGADPQTGELYLIVCYFGSWSPLADGPTFTIPEADPLKIYLAGNGEIAAHGTAEAVFPGGAEVRGTISWHAPHFEFRFEGKGIVIPALASLQQILPDDPTLCTPAGSTASELDIFAACLEGYQRSMRGLATGGAAQSEPSPGETFAPLPRPADQSGSALEAWGGRIASWQGDRASQLLTAQQATELAAVLRTAAKTAEGAHDLPTVLKFLHDFLLVSENLAPLLDAGEAAAALQEAVADAQARLLAAAARIIDEKTMVAGDRATAEAVEWLASILARLEADAAAASPAKSAPRPLAPRKGNAPPELRAAVLNVVVGLQEKFDLDTFSRRGIFDETPPDLNGEDNAILAALSKAQLFAFLEELIVIIELLRESDPEVTASNAPKPFLLLESLLQVQPHLAARHNDTTARALQRRDGALLIEAIKERARIFEIYDTLGLPLGSDFALFTPQSASLIATAEPEIVELLLSLAPDRRLDRYSDFAVALQRIADATSDDAIAAQIEQTLGRIKDSNDRIAALLAGDARCDGLARELIARGHPVLRAPLGNEGSQDIPITGKYESLAGASPRSTLQINQGGRFINGYLQFHLRGKPALRQRIQGMLSRETADRVEFAFLRFRESDGAILASGILTATVIDQLPRITTREVIGNSTRTVNYFQTTNFPAYSESVINVFSGEARNIIEAQQRVPLHSATLAEIANEAVDAKALIRQYFGADNPTDVLVAALAINTHFEELAGMVSTGHLPLLRQLYLQILSAGFPFLDDPVAFEGHELSYWETLMVAYNRDRARMPDVASFLGLVPAGELDPDQLYTYQFDILTTVATTDVGAVGAGTGIIHVQVTKTSPGGGQTVFDLSGSLAQVGVGPGLSAAVTASSDTITVKSLFDYQQANFEGGFSVTGASATAAAVIGLQLGGSVLVLYGNGLLPPVYLLSEEILSVVTGFSLSAGVDQSFGTLWDDALFDSAEQFQLQGPPLSFEARQQAEFDASVHFELDGSVLSECGWQYLREFVAEYRALFASPTTRILILGLTDTTGTEAHNLTLSQARADRVKAALETVTGPLVGFPPENLVAAGLGELPANRDYELSSINPFEARLAVGILRSQKSTIADGIDDPNWRSAVIIINDVVSTEIRSPSTAKP